jgi:tetratricopeptide (TPR) repeat protein
MSEGVGEARPEAEGELALARVALDDGDLRHAAAHAGNAIASDPTLREAYETIDELAARADDATGLFPMTGKLYIGTVAARSYVLARSGAVDEAFGLLCQVAATEPDKPWAAGWLATSEASATAFADDMDPDQAANALLRLAGSLPDPTDPDLVAVLNPFLEVARRVAARNPDRADILPALSALARRFGAHDEAIAWCQRAEQATRSASAAIMLGYALRGAGRRDEMYEAWRRALSRDNGNINLRVDIAEHLAADGRLKEGLARLEESLALEPDHPKAFPSACDMRFQSDGDIGHLVRLADWWREHPQHDYAGKMLTKACYRRPWLGMVPWASEAVASMLRHFAETQKPGESRVVRVTNHALSALEVPSALAVLRSMWPGIPLTGLEPGEDPPTPDPDIRVPLAEGRYRLWAYAGVEARPVPPAPSDAAVAAVRSLAAGGHPGHPVGAYDLAVALSGISPDDLLGLMAHRIPAPDTPAWQRIQRGDPTYWPRSAQAWACLGLLHHKADEPWPSSTRRQVLVDLLRGVEDWATDAAMNALVVAAWADPANRGDVAGLVASRFLDGLAAYRKRAVTIIGPMAHLVLATPGMNPDVSKLARETLKREAALDESAERALSAVNKRESTRAARARRKFFRR